MTLISRLALNIAIRSDLMRLVRDQQQLIKDLLEHREQEKRQMTLEFNREMHRLVAGWIISLESPEIDRRDDLHALLARLGEHIAVLEEHVV